MGAFEVSPDTENGRIFFDLFGHVMGIGHSVE